MPFVDLDFTNIETSRRMSAGTHQVSISSAEIKTAQSGNQMLAVTYKETDGSVAYDNFVLLPQSMWKLKMFLEAVFQTPLNSRMQLDPRNIIGKRLVIKVEDEEYINNSGEPATRARVTSDYASIPLDAMVGVAPSIPQTPTATPNPVPVPPVASQPQSVPVAPATTPVQPTPVVPTPQSTPTVETPVAPTPTATARPKLPWER